MQVYCKVGEVLAEFRVVQAHAQCDIEMGSSDEAPATPPSRSTSVLTLEDMGARRGGRRLSSQRAPENRKCGMMMQQCNCVAPQPFSLPSDDSIPTRVLGLT